MIPLKEILEKYATALTLPLWKWESAAPKDKMTHFTGRYTGPGEWVVQLVCLDDGQQMGMATTGDLIMRLTDDLAEKTERRARAYFEEQP